MPPDNQAFVSLVDIAPGKPVYVPFTITATDINPIQLQAGISESLTGLIETRSRTRTTPGPPLNVPAPSHLEPRDFNTYVRTYPAHVSKCKDAPAGYLCTFNIDVPLFPGTQQGMSLGDGTVRWSIGIPFGNGTGTASADVTSPFLKDQGADRPYYGYGLDKSGNIIPPETIAVAAKAASESLVTPSIPFHNPSHYDSPADRDKGISCFDFYYNAYNQLMDAFKRNSWYFEDWTNEFNRGDAGCLRDNPPCNLENDSQSFLREFRRRNLRETQSPYYTRPVKVNPPNGWYTLLRLLRIVFAFDPNDKSGPTGYGDSRYVSGQSPAAYSISFENRSSATAPAQVVVVTDQLDITKLDPATVSLGPITFGNRTVLPPPGVKSYTTSVDLRPAGNVIVNIAANLDTGTGALTWEFTSIDPDTGLPPADPLKGFLPPNVSPPGGEGKVLFTVTPKALVTGTEIRNSAAIVFDKNAPIVTPSWSNTVDSTRPASHVSPLGGTQSTANLGVATLERRTRGAESAG